jgi:hypothetical protein
VVIGEIEDDGVEMPIALELFKLLDKFEDRMSNEFPKTLPLRHIVDN